MDESASSGLDNLEEEEEDDDYHHHHHHHHRSGGTGREHAVKELRVLFYKCCSFFSKVCRAR